MRLILRNYAKLAHTHKTQNYTFASEQATPEHQTHAEHTPAPTQPNELQPEDPQQPAEQQADSHSTNSNTPYKKSRKQRQPKGVIPALEGSWQFAAPHLIIPDYNYLEPFNREQAGRKQLEKYEEGLGLTMEKHIHSKVFNEQTYFNKVARHHLSEMGPLTDAFLSQGYNFLTRKLLLHLVRNSRVGLLKQLLTRGALQGVDYVDEEVIVAVLSISQVDERNFFMLNILAYKRELALGLVSENFLPTMTQGIMQLIQEDKLLSILYHSNGSSHINKLRLLWSFQRDYLSNYNFLEYILPELKKLRFQMPDPQSQSKANKEVVSVLNFAFESEAFENLFFKMLKLTKSYDSFIKGWALVLLILSKLKVIPGIVKGESENQLHQIFALVELNFPKQIAREFLRQTMLEFLVHQDHSRIEFQNYQRCLSHWTKDYTEPKSTRYHSVLTKALEDAPERLVLTYRQQDNAQPYATTTINLLKTKIPKAPLVKSQTEVIFCLLKGDYQTVFNDFLVRYSLPSEFDRAAKFHAKLKQIDRDLKFHSDNQAALYKLKVTREFFFLQSFPQPLQQEFLEAYKVNLTVANTLDTPLLQGRQSLSEEEYKELLEYQKQTDQYMLNIDHDNEEGEIDEQGIPVQQKTFDLSTGKVVGQDEEGSEPEVQKGLEVLQILNKDIGILEMKLLPIETAEVLNELLENKLIDRNFFKSLRTLPLDQAQIKVNELLAKFSDYSSKKVKTAQAELRQEQERLVDQIEEIKKSRRTTKRNDKKTFIQAMEQDEDLDIDLQVFATLEAPDLIQIEDEEVHQEEDVLALESDQKAQLEHQAKEQQLQKEEVVGAKQSEKGQQQIEGNHSQKIDLNTDQTYKGAMTLAKILEQTDADYDITPVTMGAQSETYINELFKNQETENSTQFDGGRDDRAILFALDYQKLKRQYKPYYKKTQAVAQTVEELPEEIAEQIQAVEEIAAQAVAGQEGAQAVAVEEQAALAGEQEVIADGQPVQKSSESSLSDSEQSSSSSQQIRHKKSKHVENPTEAKDLADIMDAYKEMKQILLTAFPSDNDPQEHDTVGAALAAIYIRAPLGPYHPIQDKDIKLFEKQLRQLSEPSETQNKSKKRRDWRRNKVDSEQNQIENHEKQPQESSNPFFNTQSSSPAPAKGFFKKKNIQGFCTVKPAHLHQANEVESSQNNGIDLQKISQYRKQEVSKDFLALMQSETHIPRVGSGTTVAKYLFLQGQRGDKRGKVDTGREMTIEFTSVVGTRTKSYEKYIRNSVFNYELQDSFYQELLEDQLKTYNRNQFKMIVAHLIHYKKSFNDTLVQLICSISEKQHIGYSFVEIAHFIKANNIALSPQALENVCKTWQRFDIINQDLLPFVRDYCKKLSIPFATAYYSDLCRSLVKTKRFEKLKDLSTAVLTEIKPKPFRVDSSMVANQVPALEKAWKAKESESYTQLYLQLLDSIVSNLDVKVPQFLGDLFENYLKLRTNLNERELGCGVVCSCLKKQRFQQLLGYLDKNPALGTSYMYDRTLQALLSNFDELQDLAQKILDLSVLKNRVVLTPQQIMRSMIVFKKSTTSNAFSKFLQHCLRFQEDIDKLPEVKRQMFFVLNNNVEEVSVAGVFNLLDFIFNQKRDKERKQYRAIKLSEEEKERRLLEIQQSKSVNEVISKTPQRKKKRGEDPDQVDSFISEAKSGKKEVEQANKDQEGVGSSKKGQKRAKKDKNQKKQKQVGLVEQLLADQNPTDESLQIRSSSNDDDIISMVKSQTKKHESYKRKSIKSFNRLYEAALESQNIEEAAQKEKQEKSNLGQEGKGAKGGKGGKAGKGGKSKDKK